MSTKKRTPAQIKKEKNARYLVNKKAKQLAVEAAQRDALIEQIAAPPPAVVEPISQPMMEEDDYNEFAPPEPAKVVVHSAGGVAESVVDFDAKHHPEATESEINESVAFSALDDDEPYPKEAIAPESPSLGQGEPVDAPEESSGHTVPEDTAKTLNELCDALNYLYKVAGHVKGIKGLKQHDEGILRKLVARARQLSKDLS